MAPKLRTVLFQLYLSAVVAARSSCQRAGCDLVDETSLVQVQKTVVPGHDRPRVTKSGAQGRADLDLDSETSTEEEISSEDLKGMMSQLVHGGAKRIKSREGQIPDLSSMTNAQALADAKKATTCRQKVDKDMKRHVSCQYEMNTNQHDFNCEMLRTGWLMALGYYDSQVAANMPGNNQLGDKVHVTCESCWSGALPNCLNIESNEDAMFIVGSFMDQSDLPLVQEFWGNVKWDGPKPPVEDMTASKMKQLPGFNLGDMANSPLAGILGNMA